MTAAELIECGIPLDETNDIAALTTVLTAESALEYIKANTTLNVDLTDLDTVKALPAAAKLFVVKFSELMCKDTTVTSESLGGMSQSFGTTDNDELLWSLLNSLLGSYVSSQFGSVPRTGRYCYGR